jgi:hypothetical protein
MANRGEINEILTHLLRNPEWFKRCGLYFAQVKSSVQLFVEFTNNGPKQDNKQ